MKVLLTFPPVMGSQTLMGLDNHPPMSIYLLGSILNHNGHEAILLDPSWHIDHGGLTSLHLAEDFLSGIDAVAVSAHSFNWAQTKRFVEAVDELNPDVPIIVGGIHATYFDRHVLETTPVDFVVRGEGEKTLLKLLKTIEKRATGLEDVAGLSYKDRDGNYCRNPDAPLLSQEEYQNLPMPLLGQVPADRYYAPLLETSRGCFFNCTFCGIIHHGSWRALTAEQTLHRIGRTMELSQGRFLIPNFILFSDDCFTVDEQRTVQILEGIANRYPQIHFDLEGRLTDLQSDEVRDAIPYAQIQRFLVGIEVGYNEGFRKIKKGLTTEKVESILTDIGRSEITEVLFCTFIIGFPWETEEDCLKTIRFAARLVERYNVQCRLSWHCMVPSAIWREREKYGLKQDESFFDQANWSFDPTDHRADKENFYGLRPHIDEEVYHRLREHVMMYRAMGIQLTDLTCARTMTG